MNRKSQKYAQNNATQWKSRGFKSSSAINSESQEATHANQVETENQGTFGIRPEQGAARPSGHSFKRPVQESDTTPNKNTFQSKPFQKEKKFKKADSETAPSNNLSEKPKLKNKPGTKSEKQSTTKVQKKKKPVEGEQPEGDGEGNLEETDGKTETNPRRKKQKFQGYTLFIGNLSYDTTKEDILNHFSKCGQIKNVRIPIDKGTNQPRGFGYIEVEEHVTYEVRRPILFVSILVKVNCFLSLPQKVLSLHHTFLKRRRINVECTFGGSKTSQKRKALIKEKTLKLRFLSREGKISSAKQRPWGKFTKKADTS